MNAKRPSSTSNDRRDILGALASAGVVLAGCATTGITRAAQPATEAEHQDAEVTPGEDLMQEHGVLQRILLIYDESARRIEHNAPFDLAVLTSAASIVRRFVEEYHEKQEEQFVFPRLQRAGRELDLVAVLLRQHERGRQVTEDILRKAGAGPSPELALALRSFVRMYRPHAAREDTVIFPAFRDIVGRSGYRELGEQFEDREHERFGEHGFEATVAEVAQLETSLGIAELNFFTP